MQPDKISASTKFDSVKNVSTVEGTLNFSGSVGASSTFTRTIILPVNRTGGVLTNLLVNYNGAYNDSTEWKQGVGPLIWGQVDLVGLGGQPLKAYVKVNQSNITITFQVFNYDSNTRNLGAVNITVRAALYAVEFTE